MKTGLNSTRTATAPRYAVSAGTVAAAVATILAAHSGAARAQDAEGPQASAPTVNLEEVVVTGYRKSLNAALDTKRDSVGAVDQIVAEDIAAFPELNLAESIQRIPGVSISRDAGEGRQISVRGLGPQYTRVRINGMEALTTVSTSDANGGTNRDRSFDFNVFASELFNNITIHKTAQADIDEGSLGATVDLRTARPFDYNGFTAVAAAKEDYNDLAGTLMPRYSGLISDTFFDGKFGALLSVAYTKRAIVDDGSSTVRWMNAKNADGSASGSNEFKHVGADYTGPSLGDLNNSFRPRFPRYEEYHTDESRLGITNSLQWKPTDKTLVNFDTLFAQLDGTREEEQLENPTFSTTGTGTGGINNVVVRSATILGNNIVAGTFDNVDIRAEHRYDINDTKFRQHVLSLEQGITDTLKFDGQVGWAQSTLTSPVSTTLIWDQYGVNGYSYDFTGNAVNNRLPLLSYGTANLTDPNAWKLSQIRERPGSVKNSFTDYEGSLEWSATDSLKLKLGGQLKKYAFLSYFVRRTSEVAPANTVAIPGSQYGELAHLTGLGDLPAGSVTNWAVPDLTKAASLFNLYDPAVFPLSINGGLGSNFNVGEKDTSVYTQGEWSTELAGVPIRSNLGVRWVHTDQNSTGWTTQTIGTTSSLVLAGVENTYNDVLPSLNVVAEVTKDFQIRFGASKVMSRAGLASLNPGASVSITGQNKTVTSGNPLLDPIRGKAYDLGFEWYFAKESLLSWALFYKKIDSFVETARHTDNFLASGLPADQAYAACVAAGKAADATCLDSWTISGPLNTPGGNIKGSEVSFQQPFFFLPAPFNNFGTILNYTYVESKIKYVNTNRPTDANGNINYIEDSLVNLSKNAANATLYWDNGTWSARISAAYRSPYLTLVPGNNNNDVEGTKQTINVDFASSWNITEQFQVTLEALNLTNQFQYQYVDTNGNRMNYYHQQGRDYLVGARYKF